MKNKNNQYTKGTIMPRKCKICGDEFNSYSNGQRYCEKCITHKCLYCNQTFKVFPSHLRKGEGRYCSKSCSAKDKIEERANHWKGNQVGYVGLHVWVRKHLGRPQICQHCKIPALEKRLIWANKSKKYLRDLSDWISLCEPCHKIYDGNIKKSKTFSKTI